MSVLKQCAAKSISRLPHGYRHYEPQPVRGIAGQVRSDPDFCIGLGCLFVNICMCASSQSAGTQHIEARQDPRGHKAHDLGKRLLPRSQWILKKTDSILDVCVSALQVDL